MRSLWSETEAARFEGDLLALRVYTSRLLGQEPGLVLHGGGNTSVKTTIRTELGDSEDVLFVKGSGWDLGTIEAAGFAPVRLALLRRLADMETMSDATLVRVQRSALTDPTAPDPSVEAVLHAIIPFAFVDHTHADAVVALTNSPQVEQRIREALGDNVIIVPYVMPGFPLARAIRERTREIDWARYDGMVLLSHGVFTWGDTARDSYERMIRLVTRAEAYLQQQGAPSSVARSDEGADDLQKLARIRRAVSHAAGRPMVARLNASSEARGFANRSDMASIASRGPLTPDHIIRTKRCPVLLGTDPDTDVRTFKSDYRAYFERHTDGGKTMLDPAPRWAVWPRHGVIAFGRTTAESRIVEDISKHTIQAIQWAESLGGWRALSESELFEVEYWELEQAKLARAGASRMFDGRVALVTGAASGIGKAIAEELEKQGAAVVTLDVHDAGDSNRPNAVHVTGDATVSGIPQHAVEQAIRSFGGLDILVSNVGMFPGSSRIAELDQAAWDQTLRVNLTSHQRLLQAAIPYLKSGIDPTVIMVGSKNVPAPGPGQAAYSVSKAGLTQLARVAALELAADGIRVNVIHPNAVFDTGLWTDAILRERAAAYGMDVDAYKRSNLLGVEVTSKKVAMLVAAMAGPAFSCTTGAQIPIDGGNERVI